MSADDDIDPSFEPEDRIFHFTNSQGLYGILQSKCLWATHYQFLNDRSEFLRAQDELINVAKKAIQKKLAALLVNKQIKFEPGHDVRSAAATQAQTLVEQFYKTTLKNFGETYVFSGFCCKPDHSHYENGGQLHWATYGRQGGYAMRMNPHKLYHLIQTEDESVQSVGFISDKVVYSIGDLHKKYKNQFEEFARIMSDAVEWELNDYRGSAGLFKAAAPFQHISGTYKDAFFKSEEEARIIVWRVANPSTGRSTYDVHIRHNGGVSIPYVEMFKGALFDKINPVEAIIIGPHPDNERREIALKTYLRSVGLDAIAVHVSNVPYTG